MGLKESLNREYTYLFELVAPWNRIVIHYPKDDLILLGVVETESGRDWSCAETQREAIRCGFTPIEFETRPIESLNLDDAAITNEEGFVARFSNGYRVKLKYKQYLYLHKRQSLAQGIRTGVPQTRRHVHRPFHVAGRQRPCRGDMETMQARSPHCLPRGRGMSRRFQVEFAVASLLREGPP